MLLLFSKSWDGLTSQFRVKSSLLMAETALWNLACTFLSHCVSCCYSPGTPNSSHTGLSTGSCSQVHCCFCTCCSFAFLWPFLAHSLTSFRSLIKLILENLRGAFLDNSKITTNWSYFGASLVAQMVKNLPAMQEIQVQSLGLEDSLDKGKATHFSILAWRVPWTEEPGGLQSIGLQRVGHNWVTNAHSPTLMHYPRIYHSLPGIILVVNTKLFSLSFSCCENIGCMIIGTFSVLFITSSHSLIESLLILRDSGNICWVNKDILSQVPQEFSGWS